MTTPWANTERKKPTQRPRSFSVALLASWRRSYETRCSSARKAFHAASRNCSRTQSILAAPGLIGSRALASPFLCSRAIRSDGYLVPKPARHPPICGLRMFSSATASPPASARWSVITYCLSPHSVAVGMAVTCHPPHRSVRAELPHTAPALGFDAETGHGIRMHG